MYKPTTFHQERTEAANIQVAGVRTNTVASPGLNPTVASPSSGNSKHIVSGLEARVGNCQQMPVRVPRLRLLRSIAGRQCCNATPAICTLPIDIANAVRAAVRHERNRLTVRRPQRVKVVRVAENQFRNYVPFPIEDPDVPPRAIPDAQGQPPPVRRESEIAPGGRRPPKNLEGAVTIQPLNNFQPNRGNVLWDVHQGPGRRTKIRRAVIASVADAFTRNSEQAARLSGVASSRMGRRIRVHLC